MGSYCLPSKGKKEQQCLLIFTPATFPSLRKQNSGEITSALSKAMLTFVPPRRPASSTSTPPSPRLPPTFPDLRNEFGKLENLMWKQVKNKSAPTPVLPAANDRIHTLGYNYCPVHTEIYGSYRNQAVRGCQ